MNDELVAHRLDQLEAKIDLVLKYGDASKDIITRMDERQKRIQLDLDAVHAKSRLHGDKHDSHERRLTQIEERMNTIRRDISIIVSVASLILTTVWNWLFHRFGGA